jgi:hypothetical protein
LPFFPSAVIYARRFFLLPFFRLPFFPTAVSSACPFLIPVFVTFLPQPRSSFPVVKRASLIVYLLSSNLLTGGVYYLKTTFCLLVGLHYCIINSAVGNQAGRIAYVAQLYYELGPKPKLCVKDRPAACIEVGP